MASISIIIPVYNVDMYLDRCIESLLNQTYKDFDIFLIDDGSTDNSSKICDKYSTLYNFIYTFHKQNGGISSARNYGLEKAFNNSDSKLITFVDSDDFVSKYYLDYLYKGFFIDDTNVVSCDFTKVTESKLEDSIDFSYTIYKNEEYFLKRNINCIITWGKLFKKDDFKDIRFPEGRIHEDEATMHKVLFKHLKVTHINTVLYYYYYNDLSITNKKWYPERMDKLIAYKERMNFFKTNDYSSLYLHDVKKLMTTSIRYWKNIKRKYPEYLYLKNELNSGIKRWLICNNKQYSSNILKRTGFNIFVYIYWYYAKIRIYFKI